MKQSREELEYAISQYLDGTLLPLERNTLEERLAADLEARALLAEYRELNASLKALPVPEVAWDDFASQISRSLESADAPVRSYRIGAISWTGRLAIAAVLLFATTVAVYFVRPAGKTLNPTKPQIPQMTTIAEISGPTPQQASGNVVAEINIGPAPSLAGGYWRTTEDVVARPTVVLIDTARSAGQDSEQSPY
jgi:hypothetical protein